MLGDRDLAVWVGQGDGGVYSFSTYSYNDLNGNGNANIFQNVKLNKDISEWHFIYFGYSRKERKAAGYVQFTNRKEEISIPNLNHYVARQFLVYLAKDQFYPSYNGKVGRFAITLCDGAYNPQ